jgi:uncharacterized membrane protein YphA (DoxX/SURF4 family)
VSVLDALRRQVARPVDAWTAFWFTPLDPLSLGVCRTLVGSMMLYSHLVWGLNLEGFFGPEGWQSQEAMQSFFAEDWLPSLWWHVPAEQLRVVHLLCVVPLAMFALGILTPVSSLLALAVTISNSNRAPLANYGMDQILVMLGLYLTIGGSGARVSVDAWWRRRADRNSALRPRPGATARARLATRLIQVHYCVIYFFAGISKLQGDAWWTGDAVWLAFANLEYQAIDMTWLARYPWITQIATHGTVLWELSFPFLVWNRSLRPFVLAAGIAMHAGIGLFMGMITFGLIAIFGYIAFVPPEVLQRMPGLFSSRSAKTSHSQSDSCHSDETIGPGSFAVLPSNPGGAERGSATGNGVRHKTSEPREHGLMVKAPADAAGVTDRRVGICDPGWKHRQFAHYLARRGYSCRMTVTPLQLWCHVEQEGLSGAVLFVDRLDSREYALLLDDLSLSPLWQLPIVIASLKRSRLDRADSIQCPRLRTVELPAACRDLRAALAAVLHRPVEPAAVADTVASSRNGQAAVRMVADDVDEADDHAADSSSQPNRGTSR